MRIKLSCDACFHDFAVSDELLGRRVRCPSCGEPVRVVDADEEDDDRARRTSSSSKRSKEKKKRSGGNGLAVGLGVGGGIVVLGMIGIVLFFSMRGRTPNQSNVANAAPPGAPAAAAPAAAPPAAAPDAGPSNSVVAATSNPTAPLPGTPPTGSPATAPPATPPGPAIAATPAPPAVNATPSSPPAAAAGNPATAPPPSEAGATTSVAPPPLRGVPEPSKEELKLPQLIERVEPAVVRINVVTTDSAPTGSGFVVSDDGTVVTNYHVITDARRAEVEFRDGTTAKVVGYRHLVPKADIAIIKIDLPKEKLHPVPLATELPLKGESVATFGAPIGLSFTTSKGAISAIRKQDDVNAEMGLDLQGTWLQTDAPISPGNSGGPLTDYYGRVVGMNTMQLAVGQNLNFAVSSLDIIQALRDAPSQVKELKPEDLKPYQKNLSRKLATEEYDTDRGRRLFAEVHEIFLINASHIRNFDPTDEIWNRVILRSQKAVEKSGIELSFGQPAPDAAVLMVYLEMKRSRKGTQGTQELFVKAELICFDPLAKKNVSPLAKVWKDERSVGTVSLDSAMMGKVPRSVDENLSKFFSSFRTAYNRAVKAQKEAKTTAKVDANSGDKPQDGK